MRVVGSSARRDGSSPKNAVPINKNHHGFGNASKTEAGADFLEY
jgi:hypothetical protein